MARVRGKITTAALMLSAVGLLYGPLALGAQGLAGANPRTAVLKPASAPYIDAHTHIDQNHADEAVALLLGAMDGLNGSKAFIQTEPYGPGNPGAWDVEKILPAVKKQGGKLAVLGGGVMQQAHLFPLIRCELARILGGYIQAAEITEESFVAPPQLGSRAGVLGALSLAQLAKS